MLPSRYLSRRTPARYARRALFLNHIETRDQRLLEALRATLLKLEQSSNAPADAPAFEHLKRILLQRIAELDSETGSESAAEEAAN